MSDFKTEQEVAAEMELMVKEGKLNRLPDGRYEMTDKGKKEYMEAAKAQGINPLREINGGKIE